MLTTSDAELAGRARRLREHGMSVSAADRHPSRQPVIESYLEVGFNYRMTDIQAAVGLVQLGKLDAMVARRRELAARYQEMLADVPGLRTVRDPAWGESNFQSFWIELDARLPAEPGRAARRARRARVSPPGPASWPRTASPPTPGTRTATCP